MDEMTEWEISMLMPMAMNSHKTEWETARYISYNNAIMSGNLKKQYAERPMNELFPLPFDEKEEHEKTISDANRDILRERGKRLAEKIFKKPQKKKNIITNG